MLTNLPSNSTPGQPSSLEDAFPTRRSRRLFGPLLAFALSLAGGMTQGLAMDVRTDGDQLILSGPGRRRRVPEGRAKPSPRCAGESTTVILRNSPGGEVATGYR